MTSSHDKGGFPVGLSSVYNGSHHPEPVFTAAQWAAIQNYLAPREEENDNG